jgi:hypothetical protein
MTRTAEALKRLKVKPEQLAKVPALSSMFKHAEGGLRSVLDAMRFCVHDEVIAAFLKKYDAMPETDRRCVPWEAIALSANLDGRTLCGAIMNAITLSFGNTSRILALTAHPSLMKKRIEFAKMPSGEKDRTAVDIMVGALPSPKGPTFIGKAVFGSSAEKSEESSESSEVFGSEDDLDDLFPSPSAMLEKLVPIRQKRLGDGDQQ